MTCFGIQQILQSCSRVGFSRFLRRASQLCKGGVRYSCRLSNSTGSQADTCAMNYAKSEDSLPLSLAPKYNCVSTRQYADSGAKPDWVLTRSVASASSDYVLNMYCRAYLWHVESPSSVPFVQQSLHEAFLCIPFGTSLLVL
jgi:hypothetical protein